MNLPAPINQLRLINLLGSTAADLMRERNIPETCGNPEFDPPLSIDRLFNEHRDWIQCNKNPSCPTRPRRVINYCDPVKQLGDWVLIQALDVGEAIRRRRPFTVDTTFLDTFKDTAICDSEAQFDDEGDFLNFGSDYLDQVRRIWNIGPLPLSAAWDLPPVSDSSTDAYLERAVFDSTNAPGSPPTPGEVREWPIRSIVKECIVEPSADVVTGFFVCEKFTVKARSKPLRIIGTVATSNLRVDPSAVAHGVQWSTIFHPSAQDILRNQSGVLSRSTHCNQLADPVLAVNLPLWHPFPSLNDMGAKANCLAGSLKPPYPSPVSWGQFDPICGPGGAGNRILCSFRDQRYNSFSVSFRETQ